MSPCDGIATDVDIQCSYFRLDTNLIPSYLIISVLIILGMASKVTEFFDEITKLVEEGERQYGVANLGYTEYSLKDSNCVLLHARACNIG